MGQESPAHVSWRRYPQQAFLDVLVFFPTWFMNLTGITFASADALHQWSFASIIALRRILQW